MRRIHFLLALTVFSFFDLAGCSPKSTVGVALDQTPVISGGLGWAVVSLSYAKLLLEPASDSATSGAARRNEVGRVVAR